MGASGFEPESLDPNSKYLSFTQPFYGRKINNRYFSMIDLATLHTQVVSGRFSPLLTLWTFRNSLNLGQILLVLMLMLHLTQDQFSKLRYMSLERLVSLLRHQFSTFPLEQRAILYRQL
jgi:hypothetical protein